MSDLHDRIERLSPDAVIPYANNAKEHPDEQVKKIASSIKNYGWDQPIVVDGDNEIIKGHGRLQAAELLGLDEVPVIRREDLTDAEAKAARIADNKTAESAWNDDILSAELDVLFDIDDIEMDSLGFDDGEIDDLLAVDTDGVDELDEPVLEDKALEDVKILNLYAGIGGNRKLWGDKPDVTSVEWEDDIADVYREFYPDDTLVVDDAHEYLLEHFDEFDFIWTSPPCPTHSQMRKMYHQENNPVYPDMKLYQEILLLEHTFDGEWVVENVDPYYDPLIDGIKRGRHMFWSNFDIPEVDIPTENVRAQDGTYEELEIKYDMELPDFDFSRQKKRKLLNNCVHPKLGKHILESAINVEI